MGPVGREKDDWKRGPGVRLRVPAAARGREHTSRRQHVDKPGAPGLQPPQRNPPGKIRAQGRQGRIADSLDLVRAPRLHSHRDKVEARRITGKITHDPAQFPVFAGNRSRLGYRNISDRPDVLEQAKALIFVDVFRSRNPELRVRRKEGVERDVRNGVHTESYTSPSAPYEH